MTDNGWYVRPARREYTASGAIWIGWCALLLLPFVSFGIGCWLAARTRRVNYLNGFALVALSTPLIFYWSHQLLEIP